MERHPGAPRHDARSHAYATARARRGNISVTMRASLTAGCTISPRSRRRSLDRVRSSPFAVLHLYGSEGETDAVEGALAAAVTVAANAQRWDVVAQLARELEARRLAHASVPSLADERSRRQR